MASWSLTLCPVTYDGRLITGFAEGDAFDIAPVGDEGTTTIGADGHAVFVYGENGRHRNATINVAATGLGDLAMQQILNTQRLTKGRGGPFSIRDTQTGRTISAQSAYIRTPANFTGGTNASTRTYVLDLHNVVETAPVLNAP